MLTRFVPAFICALLLIVVIAASTNAQTAEASRPRSVAEASLRLKGVDGKVYDVAEMRGEVVMVSFGATWCVPCASELAAIEELKEEFKSKPVKFLWVSIESGSEASNALLRHYARTHRLSVPVLRDPDKAAFAQFSDRVRIPLVVFFDRQGKFAAPAHRGMSSEPIEYKNNMRRRLQALLASDAAGTTTSATMR